MRQNDFSEFKGHRCRVTFPAAAQSRFSSPPLHLYGFVRQADTNRIVIGLETPPPDAIKVSPVSVEILHPAGLVRLEAEGHMTHAPVGDLEIRRPLRSELEWVQRRRHVRAPATVPLWVWQHPYGEQRWRGTTLNISAGGLAMTVSESHLPGQRLYVDLSAIPGLPSGDIVAEVVRVSPTDDQRFQVAVRFLQLMNGQEQAIDRYVEHVNASAPVQAPVS